MMTPDEKTTSRSLASFFRYLQTASAVRWRGRVTKVVGNLVESEGPFASIGECCELRDAAGRAYPGEIVGFRGNIVLSMALDRLDGIRYGNTIVTWGARPALRVGPDLLGRVIDGAGHPIDSQGPCAARDLWALDGSPPLPLERSPIHLPIGTGVRAIDGFLTCGRGQRVGIFGGSGVGKSTLLGIMARGTSADLTVMGLVGERGREVRDFLENALGEEARRRSVVVVSTSDQSPLLRIRAGLAAVAVAEYFSAQGKHVLLVLDSLTRFAMAQREIGLAAGEPPTAKGYTPSVFTLLARLIERAGCFASGSITAFFTVLMEGDDQQDPLVDAVRGLLDGHIVLDRRLALRTHYPSIAVLDSLSRLMPAVCSSEHLKKAQRLRKLMAAYAASEDLIHVGAYQKGVDAIADQAIAAMPAINAFLQQRAAERISFEQAVAALESLPA